MRTPTSQYLPINLFREYKEARFNIFHASYFHIISPRSVTQALSEWLLHAIRFSASAGTNICKGRLWHSVIAGENITKGSRGKVEEDTFTEEEFIRLTRELLLLRDNA